MFTWFWQLFGYHVCEKFSNWVRHEQEMMRLPDWLHEVPVSSDGYVYYTLIYQERCCLECGKIEQEKLKY